MRNRDLVNYRLVITGKRTILVDHQRRSTGHTLILVEQGGLAALQTELYDIGLQFIGIAPGVVALT